MHDFLIIGGGAAGLAAALFGRRKHLSTVLLEKTNEFGGHLWHSYGAKPVLDYPGFPEGILGYDLVRRFVEHARQDGAELHARQAVERIECLDGRFRVHTAAGSSYEALVILVAIGTVPRRLGLPNEKKFVNKGIFYSLNSPGDFRDRRVLVVGGGNTALEVAMGLQGVARDVRLVHRSQFRADESLQHEFLQAGIPYDLGWVVSDVNGNERLEEVCLRNLLSAEERRVLTDALIVCAGLSPSVGFLEELGVKVNERGYVVVDQDCATNVPGVLAAGDVTGAVARLATAVGQGVTAAHTAHRHVRALQLQAQPAQAPSARR